MKECNCYDYPVSWSYWREHCWTVHGFDPGDLSESEAPAPKEEPEWTRRQYDVINQLRAEVLHLHKKVDENKIIKRRSFKDVL